MEHAHLDGQLRRLLATQRALILRRFALSLATKALDYTGALLNYACLAAAVFSGAWQQERASPGGIAQKVSVGSFYLLTLIYSFTQILDLAGHASDLVGLAARVGQMVEALEGLDGLYDAQSSHCSGSNGSGRDSGSSGRGGSSSRGSHRLGCSMSEGLGSGLTALSAGGAAAGPGGMSAGAAQPAEQAADGDGQAGTAPHALPLRTFSSSSPRPGGRSFGRYASQAVLLLPPMPMITADGHVLEVSVHSLGNDLLWRQVHGVFPNAPPATALLGVVTFQFGRQPVQQGEPGEQQQQQQEQQDLQEQDLQRQHNVQCADAETATSSGIVGTDGSSNTGSAVTIHSPRLQEMQQQLGVFLDWEQQVMAFVCSR